MLTDILRDIRFGTRVLRRSPGFTFTALLSLALGIGGATAVFSLVNAIVLRTLPVPDPQQLYVAEAQLPAREHGNIFSGPTFAAVRDDLAGKRSAELFAATNPQGMQLQPAGEPAPERGTVQLVSGEFFAVLRQRPELGRLIGPSDNLVPGGHPVAVLSDTYWRRHFSAAPDAVGRQISINGVSFAVIGIAPPRFFGTTVALRAPDVWVPFMMQSDVRYSANASSGGKSDTRKPWAPQPEIEWLTIFARVPKGVSASVAADAFTAAYRRERDSISTATTPDADRDAARQRRVTLNDASAGISSLRNTAAQPLFVLLTMVGVLLAIACGNVAGLLLARAAGRQREIAIRLSIGAGRFTLIRQLMAESLLLAIAGGLLGIFFAMWARDGLLALLVNVGSAPIDLSTGIDLRVLAFSLGVSALTGLICGVLPAIRATAVPVSDSLKEHSRSAMGPGGGRRGMLVGKTLVAVQMAFCLLLLVVAGLFARSLRSLTQTDVGFDREHVLTARLDVRGAGYAAEERLALYRRVVEALQALPGVRSASMSLNGPLANSSWISSMEVEGHTAERGQAFRTNEEAVTDNYFATVGLHIVEGRNFGAQDRSPGGHATIVNQTMAKRFFPGQSAIGKRWSYGPIDKDAFVIVGVVEDARYVQLRAAPPNMAYHLTDAVPDEALGDLEVRTTGSPGALAQTVRETLTRAEPRLPIVEVVPLADRIARGVSQDRMVARLTTMFGALALLLASLGLYGTISYGINRRVGELALRMALGADRATVLWMILREALALVLIGGALGVPLAWVAGLSMRSLLFNVGAGDPASFAIGGVVLLAVALVAAFLPAHRASRIEPMVAMGR